MSDEPLSSLRFEQMLRATLDDRRLSRSERRALSEVVADADPGGRELAMLRSVAFRLARERLADQASEDLLDWLEEVVKVLAAREREDAAPRSDARFSPGDGCLERIVGLLSATRRAADICVFTITDDRIADAIIGCHRRGVQLRVVSDDDKAFDVGSDVERLREAGIRVRVDRTPHHMHHKFAVFDRHTLLTGSYNWTRSAAAYNHENIVVTDDPRLVKSFTRAFEDLWRDLGD